MANGKSGSTFGRTTVADIRKAVTGRERGQQISAAAKAKRTTQEMSKKGSTVKQTAKGQAKTRKKKYGQA